MSEIVNIVLEYLEIQFTSGDVLFLFLRMVDGRYMGINIEWYILLQFSVAIATLGTSNVRPLDCPSVNNLFE